MSKQRSQRPKDSGLIVEEQSITTPAAEGTDPDNLPFPEFSDADVNAEKWDNSNTITKDRSATLIPQTHFVDPHEVVLPNGIVASQWKKCSEVSPNVNFVVFSQSTSYPDLVSPNRHILCSAFYRQFISVVEILLYIGSSKSFPQEYGSSLYFATEKPWRPWHHVYSNCRILKGEHAPLFNSFGKYVLRLFWMGTWRKIYVDDYVPIDASDNILLPSLCVPRLLTEPVIEEAESRKGKSKVSPAKKEIFELWPLLLCKGLLKLASLSFNNPNDFDIINCLTGWLPQRIKTKGISSLDLWGIFTAYLQRFEWDGPKEGSTKKSGSTKTKGKDTPKKGDKSAIPFGIENMREGDRFVVVTCDNFQLSDGVDDDKSITMFLSQVRDIPVIQPPPRPELEFWKTFRFEKWAVEQGIIPPDIKKLNIRSLKIVDPFRRILQNEVDKFDTQLSARYTDITDRKSEKSSKSSKKSGKSAKSTQLEPDPSTWLDYEDLRDRMSQIMIYFQPRTFKSKTRISDINFASKTTEFRHIIYPYLPKKFRNEPIYLFMDSIDHKFLAINLAQVGHLESLEKNSKDEAAESIHISTDLDMCDELVLRKTRKNVSESCCEVEQNELSPAPKSQPISLVLEEYVWSSNVIGPARGAINTYGTKSLIIDLKPGRISFRLWLSTHCSYVLQIFSDTQLTVGCLEEYLNACSVESQLLTNLCYDLSSCYGELVQSFGMAQHPVNLRNFYHCYKPYQFLIKKELVTVHGSFFEEFCKIIAENNASPSVLDCVKLLFLQLKTFDYVSPYTEEPHLDAEKFELMEQVDYAKLMQRAAVKLQAFFKSVYIRALMKKMRDNHKEYYDIFEVLKRVYLDLFSSANRLTYCPIIIRRFFERPNMSYLKNKFEIYHDIRSVLQLQIFSGVLTVNAQDSSPTWVPICRYTFHVSTPEGVLVKINLFCNLKNYYVRCFNNDTFEELQLVSNNVTVNWYSPNRNGYTVLCYGWSSDPVRANWKLVLATEKSSRNDAIFVPLLPWTTTCLRDQYKPNFDQVICRYFIRVASDVLLTAHVSTSFDAVKVCLKLLDRTGKVLFRKYGVKIVLFPVVELNNILTGSEVSIGILGQKQYRSSELSDITYSKIHGRLSAKKSHSGDESDGHKRSRRSSTESVEKCEESESTKHLVRKSSSGSRPSSRSSKSRNVNKGSVTNNLPKVVEGTHTTYILEATVMENTWPLTAEEWKRVQTAKEKEYLNLIIPEESKRTVFTPKKNTSLTLTEPYWTLDLLYFASSQLELELDTSESDRRRKIKCKWFEDIDRYKKGVQLRKEFLEKYSKPRIGLPLAGCQRSNNARDFATEMVQGEPLDEFYVTPLENIDEDFCKTKSEDDYIIDEANIEQDIKRYEANEQVIIEEMEAQLQKQKENCEAASRWFEEIRIDSAEMLEEAIALEREFVKKLSQAPGQKRDKKKKKK